MKEEPPDFWRPWASFFRQDPFRTGDPSLDALLRHVRPQDTVLDVGGGAGRFALPLALRCRQVTVVEPSQGMVEVLQEEGIANVDVVVSTWEEAQVEPHEVVLCSHVLYGVERVDLFVQKLVAHTRRLLLVLMFMDAPINAFSRAWRLVRRERRIGLPGLSLLLPLLWEMGLYPHLEMVQPMPRRPFPDRQAALEELRRRLYIVPGTQEDARLHRFLPRLLEETGEGLHLRGVPPNWEGLLVWAPSRS